MSDAPRHIDLKQSQLRATFHFSIDSKPETRAKLKSYAGQMQLFEYHFCPGIDFWFGVAEVECTQRELAAVQRLGKDAEFRIDVHLEDTRRGRARLLTGPSGGNLQGPYILISMVGYTVLDREV